MEHEKEFNEEMRRQEEALARGIDTDTPTPEAPYGTRGGHVCKVRPQILTVGEAMDMIPPLKGHPGLVRAIMKWLWLDKANYIHGKFCYETGIPFSRLLIDEAFKVKLRVDNEDVLRRFPTGPFITVSNHPLGALDGIALLDIVGSVRPDFQVMVNMFLNYLSAMRSSFIAVDPSRSDDPKKRLATMNGIKQAMRHVKEGHPIGFFPAGAVAKIGWDMRVHDREWQPSVIRLIKQLRVPVIPIYFHDHNSAFFNILGRIDWRLRTLRLPRELFNKTGKTLHVSIGEPIMPDYQAAFTSVEDFGRMLRERTEALASIK